MCVCIYIYNEVCVCVFPEAVPEDAVNKVYIGSADLTFTSRRSSKQKQHKITGLSDLVGGIVSMQSKGKRNYMWRPQPVSSYTHTHTHILGRPPGQAAVHAHIQILDPPSFV